MSRGTGRGRRCLASVAVVAVCLPGLAAYDGDRAAPVAAADAPA